MLGRIKQYFKRKKSEKTFRLWISLNKGTILKVAEPEQLIRGNYGTKIN